MAQYIEKDALVAEIEKLKDYAHNGVSYHQSRQNVGLNNELSTWEHLENAFATILKIIDTLEVKEVELEKEIKEEYLKRRCYGGRDNMLVILNEPQFNKIAKHFFELGLKAQTKWQKERLWKLADGDDLPEIDREVIALLDNGKIVFAHRPPEYWDGKDIDTDKVTRHYPKTYDKGGWNIPNVKYWLDCLIPKEIEL